MKLNEANETNQEELKKRIRRRYRGTNLDNVTIIPAKEKMDIYKTEKKIRVAVYARVSTDDPKQTSSYELQKNYYEEKVRNHMNWELVGIYADEGISGTSLEHRDEFVKMIADCEKGKIDLIITKNVARYARNVEDCLHYVRKLRSLKSPVGVLFETEGIYTLNKDSDMQLSFCATMAQEESHTKAESMNRSYEMRFESGIYMTPRLLGFDIDEDGEMVINEDEALTVRMMFLMYLAGIPCKEIAENLIMMGRTSRKGNLSWTSQAVYLVLRNEKYCGDLLVHKTFTPDYITHRSVKNRGERNQYYVEGHHKAIIDRDDFIAVQKMLDQKKYRFKNISPELKVIDKGILKGFVELNPCWVGFGADEYLEACYSVLEDKDYLNPTLIFQKKKGDFDFGKYQVVRSQFVKMPNKIQLSITSNYIRFSMEAVKAFPGTTYVELLFHPIYQILAVREGNRKNPHAVKWADATDVGKRPVRCNGIAYLTAMFELCEWSSDYIYLLEGYIKAQGNEKIILFFLDEPEMKQKVKENNMSVYPAEWAEEFGDYYYEQKTKENIIFRKEKDWDVKAECVTAKIPDFTLRQREEVQEELNEVLEQIQNAAGS